MANIVDLAPAPPPPITMPYGAQVEQIKRQQAIADALRMQSSDAIPIQSSNGIQAPIPWTAILAKAMQGGAAGYKEARAAKLQKELGQRDVTDTSAMLDALRKRVPGTVADQTMINPTTPQLPGGPAQAQQPGVPLDIQRPAMTEMPLDQKLDVLLRQPQGGPGLEAARSILGGQITGQMSAQQQAEQQRQQALWQNRLPQSAASQQEQAGSLRNAENLAAFTNKLPQTANEQATTNKPQFAPFGSPGYFTGGTYHAFPNGGAGAPPVGAADDKSTSLQVQLGISNNAWNMLQGNTGTIGNNRQAKAAANAEIDALVRATGLDQSVLQSRIKGFQDSVKMNQLQANSLDKVTNEILGTLENFAPVADQIGGNFRFANGVAQIVGTQANTEPAQKYALFLEQARSELAGLHAAMAGKVGLHGQIQADSTDFTAAEKIIKDGLSRRGAMGLATGIQQTLIKNKAIVENQSVNAQRGIWNAFGKGKQFDATHPQQAGEGGGGGGGDDTLDQQAVAWAKAHPNDPRSAEIKRLHGVP